MLSVAAVVSVVAIISLGIFALTHGEQSDKFIDSANVAEQTSITFKLFSETAYSNTADNYSKVSAAIKKQLKSERGFQLVPDISLVDDDTPSHLYFAGAEVGSEAEHSQTSLSERFKLDANTKVMIYKRLDLQGNMQLAWHSLYELPTGFRLKFIPSALQGGQKSRLIENIFRGQSYTTVQSLNGTLYSITFEQLTNKKGVVIGMIAILTKLNGVLDFDFLKLSKKYYILDKVTGQVIFPEAQDSKYSKSEYRWIDSLRQASGDGDFAFIKADCGRVAVSDSRLNWIMFTELPTSRKTTQSELQINAVKMVAASGFLVLIVVIFIAIFLSDRFTKKADFKEAYLNDVISNIIFRRYSENTNDFIERAFKQKERDSFCTSHVFNMLQKINSKMSDLEQDNSDLHDILHSKLKKATSLVEKLKFNRDSVDGVLTDATGSLAEVVSQINQLSGAVKDILTLDNLSETILELDALSGYETIKDKSQNLRAKIAIISDKVEKAFSELSAIKKSAENAYLLSVNSAVSAEKSSSSKLSVLSYEASKMSDSLSNAVDQISYLLSEARNAAQFSIFDIENIHKTLSDKPSQGSAAQAMLEYTRFNEKAMMLTNQCTALSNECQNVLKTLEAGKSNVGKSEAIISDFMNLADGID